MFFLFFNTRSIVWSMIVYLDFNDKGYNKKNALGRYILPYWNIFLKSIFVLKQTQPYSKFHTFYSWSSNSSINHSSHSFVFLSYIFSVFIILILLFRLITLVLSCWDPISSQLCTWRRYQHKRTGVKNSGGGAKVHIAQNILLFKANFAQQHDNSARINPRSWTLGGQLPPWPPPRTPMDINVCVCACVRVCGVGWISFVTGGFVMCECMSICL